LDGNGAEKLLGRGDMLFLEPGQAEPVRIHGALITSEETGRLVEILKTQDVEVRKIETMTEEAVKQRALVTDADPLFKEAAEMVIRHKQGSVSLLQRRLGIGYQRAARLIDLLEAKGVVGPYDGSKAREVLADQTYLEKLRNN
jgi:S-DNA-T family DNA segregation ATPase FtsK/SpoIIIE